MSDLCHPRGIGPIERKHHGQTGLAVCGRFKPVVYWISVKRWFSVAVRLDGSREDVADLWEAKPGPVWVGLTPGRHLVDFIGDDARSLRSETVEVSEGEAVLISFRAPIWRPFMKPTSEHWCRRRLW